MADQDAQDKNLPASAKKIERSRAEGQVPRSRDLAHFAVLLGGGAVLWVATPTALDWLQQALASSLRFDAQLLATPGILNQRLGDIALRALMLVLPLGLVIMALAVAANLLLGGWNWTFKPLFPNFSKLDPISGFGRLFQAEGLIQAGKASLLALLVGVVGALVLKDRIAAYVGIMSVPLPAALAYAGQQLMAGLSLVGLTLALFALVDLPLQRHLYLKRLRMSREEMKKEMKEQEGNLEMKAKMRAKAREMAKRRMLAAVPSADLVVMNPTHYAVALKYEEGRMAAPKVVAKGVDLLAMKIRDVATGAKVPVLQSPMLARALYAHGELDREIPAALFSAVAQVLAYVYQLRAAMAGRAPLPTAMPDPKVPPELDPHNKPGWRPDDLDAAEEDEA